MPVMDGYTAARKIRALEDPSLARIPIIALSANAFDEDREASYEAGMNAHLAKPSLYRNCWIPLERSCLWKSE